MRSQVDTMAAGNTTANAEQGLMTEVLLRVKQELAAFQLSVRDQCRRQIDVGWKEQCTALDALREECVNLRGEVGRQSQFQEVCSSGLLEHKKDQENQIAQLKEYLRDNAQVCSDMADRILVLQEAVEGMKAFQSREGTANTLPGDANLESLIAAINAERQERETMASDFTELFERQQKYFDEQLADGIKQGCMAFVDEVVQLGVWKQEMERLQSDIDRAHELAAGAVTTDMLELKVQEILMPLQASMVTVTEEFEGVIAAVGIAKQNDDQDGTKYVFKPSRGAAVSNDKVASSVIDDLVTVEQIRSCLEGVTRLQDAVPDPKQLKVLGMEVDKIKSDISELRNMDIKLSDFSNDLHTAFETFRVEMGQRLEHSETRHALTEARQKRSSQGPSIDKDLHKDDNQNSYGGGEPKLREAHHPDRQQSQQSSGSMPQLVMMQQSGAIKQPADRRECVVVTGSPVLASSQPSRSPISTPGRSVSVMTGSMSSAAGCAVTVNSDSGKVMHSFPQHPVDFCTARGTGSPRRRDSQVREVALQREVSPSSLKRFSSYELRRPPGMSPSGGLAVSGSATMLGESGSMTVPVVSPKRGESPVGQREVHASREIPPALQRENCLSYSAGAPGSYYAHPTARSDSPRGTTRHTFSCASPPVSGTAMLTHRGQQQQPGPHEGATMLTQRGRPSGVIPYSPPAVPALPGSVNAPLSVRAASPIQRQWPLAV
jgi:hypothetical protein